MRCDSPQISSVYRRVKDKIDAKAASFHEGFVEGLLPTFGAGVGLMAKETSLEIREGNDVVIRCVSCFRTSSPRQLGLRFYVRSLLSPAALVWCSTCALA